MLNGHWKRRAEQAEADLAALKAQTAELIAGLELLANERAVLLGITSKDRTNRFLFSRNGKLFTIETMGSWGNNVAQWKKDLLEPLQ